VELEGRDIRHDARSGSLIGRVRSGARHHLKPRPVGAASRRLRAADVAEIPSDDEKFRAPCAPERDGKVLPSHRLRITELETRKIGFNRLRKNPL
jgi:hypothetical protein